jgi:hypothetical protein
MRSEPARWCPKCHLRIAPYDLRTIYNRLVYHQHCFLVLVREEADREKARRAEVGIAHGEGSTPA